MKLNVGCGRDIKEGWINIDIKEFAEDVTVLDVGKEVWPWEDNSVEEIHCSHMIEHLKPAERIHFVNEAYRVLQDKGKAIIIAPHWGSCRAYGDLTHEWPPVSEFWFYYLSKAWREQNAPHNDAYTCDFEAVWGYSMHPSVVTRNQEYQQFAMANYKEAIQDVHCTLTKKA